MLSGPHRPSQDAVLDYLISVTGEGLAAETVVRALKGDPVVAYPSDLADRFRAWLASVSGEASRGSSGRGELGKSRACDVALPAAVDMPPSRSGRVS